MRLLDRIQPAGPVLRGVVPGVDRLADEGAERRTGVVLDLRHRQHFIDDAGQLQAGLRAIDLRLEDPPVEVVQLLVEDPDEPDVLRPRVLQMRKPRDHLAAVQSIGAANIRLACLVGERFRLTLAPLEAQASCDRDRVDEDGLIAIKRSRIAEAFAHGGVVCFAVDLVIAQRRIGAADEHREVTAFGPCARANAVARPALDGEIASFQINEERDLWIKRPKQARLADAGLTEDAAFDAAHFGHALLG